MAKGEIHIRRGPHTQHHCHNSFPVHRFVFLRREEEGGEGGTGNTQEETLRRHHQHHHTGQTAYLAFFHSEVTPRCPFQLQQHTVTGEQPQCHRKVIDLRHSSVSTSENTSGGSISVGRGRRVQSGSRGKRHSARLPSDGEQGRDSAEYSTESTLGSVNSDDQVLTIPA